MHISLKSMLSQVQAFIDSGDIQNARRVARNAMIFAMFNASPDQFQKIGTVSRKLDQIAVSAIL